jgi:N6-L-threonylcarbamoyladenine synthase
MLILSIETSCDETAASVVKTDKNNMVVMSNIISSQIKLHTKWGGVVPNLAAREHLKNILPVIKTALKESGISASELDLIAVTNGPGLIPSLLIGTNTAKTLSYLWKKPLLGIHHIEGHIYANFIGTNTKSEAHNTNQILKIKNQKSKTLFPILCLIVSGGHTQLVLMKDHLNYKIVGQTLDDAAGEAFDKVARILNLGYPGGPAISQLAAKWKSQIKSAAKHQNPNKFKINLPRPMINSNNLDFSFSGLKTAVLYETKKHPELLKNKNYVSALCSEFQQAVIDVLVSKTLKAAQIYKPKTIMLAGGVSANQELRQQMGEKIKKETVNTSYLLPEMQYSIDNAAMIAAAGFFRWKKLPARLRKDTLNNWKKIKTNANLKLKNNHF